MEFGRFARTIVRVESGGYVVFQSEATSRLLVVVRVFIVKKSLGKHFAALAIEGACLRLFMFELSGSVLGLPVETRQA